MVLEVGYALYKAGHVGRTDSGRGEYIREGLAVSDHAPEGTAPVD